jgi:uncharacterized membrane protein
MSFSLDNSDNPYKSIVQRGLVCAIFTLMVLFIFQPFGTYESNITYKYLKLSGYGAVTFCALVLAGIIELSLLNRDSFKPYLKWLNPLLYFSLCAVFNHGYFAVSVLSQWHWQNQLLFFVFVAAIGLFLILFMWLVNRHSTQLVLVTKQNSPSEQLNTQTEDIEEQQHIAPISQVQLQGDNKNEHLSLRLSQLVCIKAADNYCEITIKTPSSVDKILLRTSLNNLLTQFPTDSNVHRCHRSYAVNLDAVKSYSGNASGLSLTTALPELSIPVSRAYVKDIKSRLSLTP